MVARKRIGRLEILKLAGEAGTDPRSVAKRLRGEPVRGFAGERIENVLRKRGIIEEAAVPQAISSVTGTRL